MKYIIALFVLATASFAQGTPGGGSGIQTDLICSGRTPGFSEKLELFHAGPDNIRFLSRIEEPNSFGYLAFGRDALPRPGAVDVGLCIRPGLNGIQRTPIYASNEFGVASFEISGIASTFPGSWSFQRVHRDPVLGWTSGWCVEATIN